MNAGIIFDDEHVPDQKAENLDNLDIEEVKLALTEKITPELKNRYAMLLEKLSA